MRVVWLVVTAVTAGCWTGSSAPAPDEPIAATAPPEPQPPLRFRIKLERTPCLGSCPVYSVVIHGDGRVDWTGIANVAAIGPRQGRAIPRGELERLVREVDRARFFERNDAGELPTGPVCTTINGMTTCSYSAHFCSDTSHARLTVSRGGLTHTIDNDHCDDKPGIDDLEAAVDDLAGTGELVGR